MGISTVARKGRKFINSTNLAKLTGKNPNKTASGKEVEKIYCFEQAQIHKPCTVINKLHSQKDQEPVSINITRLPKVTKYPSNFRSTTQIRVEERVKAQDTI